MTRPARKNELSLVPKPPANEEQEWEDVLVINVDPKTVIKTIAAGICMAGMQLIQQAHRGRTPPPTESGTDVLTADEVAAFLGVDRNTVYEYAGRGVIPHQRLGKRILFRRGALVSWLDASCKATSARKG